MTLNQFIQQIEWKKIEGNRTYITATVNGRKYGQSYQDQACTLGDMIRQFAVFYYPFIQE